MPKLYEYLGIVIFFYANEHEPVHVHARKGGFESKIEFIIIGGEVKEVVIKEGNHPVGNQELTNPQIRAEQAPACSEKWSKTPVLGYISLK